MQWFSGFNANGKIIQLVDYSNIRARTTLQQGAVDELKAVKAKYI